MAPNNAEGSWEAKSTSPLTIQMIRQTTGSVRKLAPIVIVFPNSPCYLFDRLVLAMNVYEICLTEPVVPATVLLLLVVAYWSLVILGAFDIDGFDFDIDADGGFEGLLGVGMAVFRFLNLGEIPLMLWVSVYALSYWMTSVLWFDENSVLTGAMIAQMIFRNLAVALVATKLITQPMLRFVDKTKVTRHYEMVGQIAQVTTNEVSEHHGQARVATDSSPMLINVRTRDGILHKGDDVQIIDYDEDQHIFYVAQAPTEVTA